MDISFMEAREGKKWELHDFKTDETNGFHSKEEAKKQLEDNVQKLADLQDRLYAQNQYGFLLVIQAMDAAGKDGLIKHVMSGLNPQGTQVISFKQPSSEELDHDFLWRVHKNVPERGRIGIFNRSYYEEVLVVRVHNLVKNQNLPQALVTDAIWKERFEQIRHYEKYLTQNGIVVVKLFLHLSKQEQKKRFLKRIDDPTKNWKFSAADVKERSFWKDYQVCYEEAIRETSTKEAPWYIIPADKKWFTRLAASEIIVQHLEKLKPAYPKLPKEQLEALSEHKAQLLKESENE